MLRKVDVAFSVIIKVVNVSQVVFGILFCRRLPKDVLLLIESALRTPGRDEVACGGTHPCRSKLHA